MATEFHMNLLLLMHFITLWLWLTSKFFHVLHVIVINPSVIYCIKILQLSIFVMMTPKCDSRCNSNAVDTTVLHDLFVGVNTAQNLDPRYFMLIQSLCYVFSEIYL